VWLGLYLWSGSYQAIVMALKDPKMNKQGTATKQKHVTLMIPQKLEVTLVSKKKLFFTSC
jgi:hypothetical protein